MSELIHTPVDGTLDATGLNCPEPVMMLHQHIRDLVPGGLLKVIATDAGSQRDFRTFAKLAGHVLVHEEADNGVYRYWLRKA